MLSIKNSFRKILKLNRKKINTKNKKRLTNKDFTIICNNCTAGMIYNDLGLEFLSPTINCYMDSNSFINFLENIEYYLKQELREHKEHYQNYPIGKFDKNTYIHFVHYENFETAKDKWNERKKINFDNLFIMDSDRDGMTKEIMDRFDKLPYKKVMFTNRKHPEFDFSYYIKGFEKDTHVGNMLSYSGINGRRYYDQFDYIKWLNN